MILADSSICEKTKKWSVTFEDGASYDAALKKKDLNTGLAMFSVRKADITDATWSSIKVSALGNSNVVTQGDLVMSLGNMFGYPDGMGYGIVSATDYRASFYDGECNVLSTDIAYETGGTGVLFNMDGEVVGIVPTSVWKTEEQTSLNAYAISDLKTVIEIMANGESVPYIGIHGTTVTQTLKDKQGMPSGVYVVDVDPDSPAMEAGIQSGDVICQVDGKDVGSISTYQSAVLETEVGRVIRLQGRRLGADGYVELDFSVTVGSKE